MIINEALDAPTTEGTRRHPASDPVDSWKTPTGEAPPGGSRELEGHHPRDRRWPPHEGAFEPSRRTPGDPFAKPPVETSEAPSWGTGQGAGFARVGQWKRGRMEAQSGCPAGFAGGLNRPSNRPGNVAANRSKCLDALEKFGDGERQGGGE
jgi:hypothetical protein